MTSESRAVITSFDKPIQNQTSIPWCTTHDAQQSKVRSHFCCESWNGLQQPKCVISTGPPDHFWWKDE